MHILYIGNKLSDSNRTVTSVETLGTFLSKDGHDVRSASSFVNVYLRMVHMIVFVVYHCRWADIVLIDTYSTRNFWYAVIIGRLCVALNLPFVLILRGGNLPHRIGKSAKAAKSVLNRSFMNICPSKYLFEELSKIGVPNLKNIPNTIKLEGYNFKPRVQLKPRLLWVRSFASIYNPKLALLVMEDLKSEFPEVTICMVGPDKDGSLYDCQDYAKMQGLTVHFTGKLEKEEWIRMAAGYDIFLNTTNFDNMPVSVSEAMALGLPVVSTNVGGMPFLIEDGVDGILVLPGDTKAMAGAIKDLLADPEKARKMAARARKKVEGFDWKVVAGQWKELLGE